MPDKPTSKQDRPVKARTCWKCRYDLTGLGGDTDCPECGADQPIDEIFDDDHDPADTVFQRIDGPPMWAAGVYADVGKQSRPSAHSHNNDQGPTPEEMEQTRRSAAFVYRWCGRLALLIIAAFFTFLAVREARSQQVTSAPWVAWTYATVAAIMWIALIAAFVVRTPSADDNAP